MRRVDRAEGLVDLALGLGPGRPRLGQRRAPGLGQVQRARPSVARIRRQHEQLPLLQGAQVPRQRRTSGRFKISENGDKPIKPRASYGAGNTTSDLIAACLKKARKPVGTKYIANYLKENGNKTIPSVELSRMITKGLVNRPARGLYEWTGG